MLFHHSCHTWSSSGTSKSSLRLNVLNNFVDYFVIVEGNKTWQNNPKKLRFNIKKFKKFEKKMVKKQKAKIAKSLCNGDFRFVGILACGRVLRWDLLVVKAHGVYLRRAYFQEHPPKRGGVVPICSFQLITISELQPLVPQRLPGLWQS